MGFPGGSEVKASAWNAGDPASIPGLGRSPGEGNCNPLQYSFLENPMEGGAWQATVHVVTKSQTQLSDYAWHTAALKGTLATLWIYTYTSCNIYITFTLINILFTTTTTTITTTVASVVSDSLQPHEL